jgi:hypothetical protein
LPTHDKTNVIPSSIAPETELENKEKNMAGIHTMDGGVPIPTELRDPVETEPSLISKKEEERLINELRQSIKQKAKRIIAWSKIHGKKSSLRGWRTLNYLGLEVNGGRIVQVTTTAATDEDGYEGYTWIEVEQIYPTPKKDGIRVTPPRPWSPHRLRGYNTLLGHAIRHLNIP